MPVSGVCSSSATSRRAPEALRIPTRTCSTSTRRSTTFSSSARAQGGCSRTCASSRCVQSSAGRSRLLLASGRPTSRLSRFVSCAPAVRGADPSQALADFIKRSTSDSLPSALALDAFSLLQLATSALQHTVSPVWLSIAASLLARLARDESDHDMSDAAVARLAQPVETGMGAMLALLVDLRGTDCRAPRPLTNGQR